MQRKYVHRPINSQRVPRRNDSHDHHLPQCLLTFLDQKHHLLSVSLPLHIRLIPRMQHDGLKTMKMMRSLHGGGMSGCVGVEKDLIEAVTPRYA
jgi:hypothetical protein